MAPPPEDAGADGPAVQDEAAAVERAMAALEGQRAVLGDTVVDTALGPLRRRLAELSSGTEERRQVTVLFADLAGFTAMSEHLDAEDVRSIVDRYFTRWLHVVALHGGEVEKFIGDAVMAVFGVRRSYGDDAERAVRAALAMLSELDALNDELQRDHGVRLAARIGIDTGDVVVSTLGDRDGAGFVVVGPAVNRASRLETAAPVGRVQISAETQRLVRGAFATEPRPGLTLKGVDAPVDAHLVLGPLASGFRLERAAPVEGVTTRTVGRQVHAAALQQHLAEVTATRTHRTVTVVGEPGVGKTRLLHDFDSWLLDRPDDVWFFRGRASPTARSSVGGLLRDVMSARIGVRLDDDRSTVRRRFDDAFAVGLGREEGHRDARLVAAWLRFAPGGDDVPSDPKALRDRGSAALAGYFRSLTRWGPVVLLLEDLHWADDESMRWLEAAGDLLTDAPVLVVGSARPTLDETRPGWGVGAAHHRRLEVAPLDAEGSRALLGQLLARISPAPVALTRQLLEAGEGNPFYLEELVGWLIDAGVIVRDEPHWRVDDDQGRASRVPPTLRGVLQARLDALGKRERAALQRAAVIGRVFWEAAVDRLDTRPGSAAGALDRLHAREVVLGRAESRFRGTREFAFKHALLRDVAYEGVLRRSRERFHRAAAHWLTESSAGSGRAEEYAAVIAEHLDRARDPEAAEWYLRAAAQAAAVYAASDAHALLDAAERTAAPDAIAVRFDIALAREALQERAGDRDAQQATLATMDALAGQVDGARRVRHLLARARFAFVRSDYGPALADAVEAERTAAAARRADLAAEAVLIQGKTRTWLDEVDAARSLLGRAVAAGGLTRTSAVVAEGRRYLCILDGNVGAFDAALEHGRAARDLFRAIGDAEMEAMAQAQTATTFYRMGRYADAQTALEEALPAFRRAGHRYREVMATANLASVAVMRGDHAAAIRSAEGVLGDLRDLGDREALVVALITLGAARLLVGDGAGATPVLDEAAAISRELGSATLEADALVRSSHLALVGERPDEAVTLAARAVVVGAAGPSALERATAQLALGHAALAADKGAEAAEAFAAAAHDLEGSGQHGPLRETVIGLAASQSLRCDAARGVEEIEPVLEHLTLDGLSGVLLPGVVLGECVAVLERAGDPRAPSVRELACELLRSAAAAISDPALAEAHLALPPHAALLRAPAP